MHQCKYAITKVIRSNMPKDQHHKHLPCPDRDALALSLPALVSLDSDSMQVDDESGYTLPVGRAPF